MDLSFIGPALLLAMQTASPTPQLDPNSTKPGDTAPTPPVQVTTPDVVIPPRVTLPAGAAARPLSGDEAVRLALSLQPTLDVARANVLAARGRTTQARAGLGPRFGFTSGYSLTQPLDGSNNVNGNNANNGNPGGVGGNVGGGGNSGSDPFFPGLIGNAAGSLRTNLVLNQLLFDFNRTRDTVRQQEALTRAAQGNLSTAALDVAQQVRTRLADLAQNARLVAVAEANVRNRQSQLDLANARLQAGLGAPADVVRAKTSLADAVTSLIAAREAEDASRVLLAEALGVDPLTPIVAADEEASPLDGLPPETLVETGLARRPEIVAGRENVRAAEFGVSAARKTNLPSVDLSLGAGTRGTNSVFGNPTATLGITLSWNFGDAGLTRGRTEEARANETAARANLIRAGQLVVGEVARAYLAVENARQRVTLADVAVANAQESLRLAEGRYRGGVGTFLEITDAQAALFTAQRNAETARGDLSRARANLRRATGEPVDIPRPPIPESPPPSSSPATGTTEPG